MPSVIVVPAAAGHCSDLTRCLKTKLALPCGALSPVVVRWEEIGPVFVNETVGPISVDKNVDDRDRLQSLMPIFVESATDDDSRREECVEIEGGHADASGHDEEKR